MSLPLVTEEGPEIRVTDGFNHVSVQMIRRGWPIGVVEASVMSKGIWFLNRAVIRAETDRRKGVGSQLLIKLLEKLKEQPDCKRLVVTPGGYGSDPSAQENFYLKNGFKLHKRGYFYWEVTWPIPSST